jgi:integrase
LGAKEATHKPVFGDCDPRTVTLEDIALWRQAIERSVSQGEAHRATKIWRALWKVMAALGYCMRDADPSLAVPNTAPKGRSATWIEGEAARLYKRAWRMGYHGLSALIAVSWSTMMQPGDVRALRAIQLARTKAGMAFFTERGKTGVPVGGALNDRAVHALAAYLNRLDLELHGEAYVFRNRSGQPYSKDTLGDDFRAVRTAEFGGLERRTLSDFRRSGAVEAIAGGANVEQLAHAMGNTLNASNQLYETYVPVNSTSIADVMEARRRGRSKNR